MNRYEFTRRPKMRKSLKFLFLAFTELGRFYYNLSTIALLFFKCCALPTELRDQMLFSIILRHSCPENSYRLLTRPIDYGRFLLVCTQLLQAITYLKDKNIKRMSWLVSIIKNNYNLQIISYFELPY